MNGQQTPASSMMMIMIMTAAARHLSCCKKGDDAMVLSSCRVVRQCFLVVFVVLLEGEKGPDEEVTQSKLTFSLVLAESGNDDE